MLVFIIQNKGSIPVKGSVTPYPPRRHFGSYGQLPMPFFSPLDQDSPQLSPGCTTCAASPRAGAVVQEQPSASRNHLGRCFSGNAFQMMCPPIISVLANHWACIYSVISAFSLTDFLFVAMYDFPTYKLQW
jgi:hypothetical protein